MKDRYLSIHAGIAIFYVLLFSFLTFRYVPQPFSDFQYFFWQVSDNFHSYHKGGLLHVLYLPLKKTGLTAYISAFIVNSFCWILLAFSLWFQPGNGAGRRLQIVGSLLLFLFGIWWAGMSPLVNSDLPHAAFVAFGLSQLFRSLISISALTHLFPSVIFLSAGLSMRTQGMLAFGIVLLLLAPVYLAKRFRTHFSSYKRIALILFVSIVISFSVELFFRNFQQDVRTTKLFTRSTLYTGLIATNLDKDSCGGWTEKAIDRAAKDLDLPLSAVIYRYLKTSHSELAGLISCKIGRYFSFDGFSFYWLQTSLENQPGSSSGVNLSTARDELFQFSRTESLAGKGIKLLLFLLFVAGGISPVFRVRTDLWVFACLLSVAYLFEHAVLEIQPRYILGPVTFSVIALLYGMKMMIPSKADSPCS